MSTLKTTNLQHEASANPNIVLDNSGGVSFQGDVAFDTDTLFVDSVNNRVGIGTTSPSYKLDVDTGSNGTVNITDSASAGIRLVSTFAATGRPYLIQSIGSNGGLRIYDETAGSERARIDSSGRLLVGTSSAMETFGGTLLQVADAAGATAVLGRDDSTVAADNVLGSIYFNTYAGSSWQESATIRCFADANQGSGDVPSRLVFSTTADGANSPDPRMTIKEDGVVAINASDSPNGEFFFSSSAISGAGAFRVGPTSGTFAAVIFYDGANTDCGSIDIDTTANTTAYTTSSDYRLKQDVKPLVGSIDRVLQLKPCEWNWVGSPETRGEGFLAHEAQEIVPESVTGTKDEVDADGNPVYQGIDQSKLVPLLTAALQEALAEIKSLKARVTALEP